MALDNIHDEAMAGFFDSLVHYIDPPKIQHQSYTSGHMQSASTANHSSSSRRRRRRYNNGHSYNYNMFADHHQYNVMDYVRWLNMRGEINYTPDNTEETEFSLNPDAPDHTHSMKSVDIRVLKTKSQYKGKPIYQAVFFRNSEPQEGGRGMPYGPGDGFDELANFMLMYHNNYADAQHYLVPQLYKRDPKTKQFIKRYGHRVVNRQTADWVKHQRQKFIKSYHAQWKTYRSAFETSGMNFNYSAEHRHNSIRPAQHNYIRSKESQGHAQANKEGHYKDRGFAKDKKCYQGDRKKNYFYKNSAAHRYFHNDRGLADNLIYSLLKQDRLRSYNGELHFKAMNCSSNDEAMKLQRKFPKGSRYFADKHLFVGVLQNYHPCVEFPWKQAKVRTYHASPKQLKALIGKYNNVWSYRGNKLENAKTTSLPITLNKNNQIVFKNNPLVHAILSYSSQTSGSIMCSIRGAYVKRPIMQWDLKHQKTVGADRIYLQSDHHNTSKAYPRKDGTYVMYYGAKDKANYNLFSRGKQIARDSKYGYGWNFSTMGDTVHPSRNELYVFEDPIDALSFYNLHNSTLRHKNCTFLSLGGVGKSYAINDFLKNIEAQPGEFSKVHLCFDNDRAGYQGTERIMASNRNKIAYVNQGKSISVNPVTHTKQSIDVIVPNAHKDVITSKIVPTAPKNVKVKDFNDVCQYINRLNKYRHANSRDVRKVYDQPDTKLDISDYSQMVTDKYLDAANTLSDLGHKNGQHMQNIFTEYAKVGLEYNAQEKYLAQLKRPIKQHAQLLSRKDMLLSARSGVGDSHLEEKYLQQPKIQTMLNAGPQISSNDKHIKAMANEFSKMDKFGQDTFMGFMQLAGGKSLSPHDLAVYAGHHKQFARSLQTVRDLGIDGQNFKPTVKKSVNYTANRISSVQNRKKYTLALQSLQLMMPVYCDEAQKKPKMLSYRQRQNVEIGSLIYKNVVGSIHNNSLPNMLDADEIKRSIQHYVMPAYVKKHQPHLDTAIKAAYQKGPITLRDWYQEQAESHRPVIKNINQYAHKYHELAVQHQSQEAQQKRADAKRQAVQNQNTQHETKVHEIQNQQKAKEKRNEQYENVYGVSYDKMQEMMQRRAKIIHDGKRVNDQADAHRAAKSKKFQSEIKGNQSTNQKQKAQQQRQQRRQSNNGISRD